jgi:hypothetical protein
MSIMGVELLPARMPNREKTGKPPWFDYSAACTASQWNSLSV